MLGMKGKKSGSRRLPQCTFRFAGLLRNRGTLRLGFLRLFDGCNTLLPVGNLELFSHISCLREVRGGSEFAPAWHSPQWLALRFH